jgi:hypothetical protein
MDTRRMKLGLVLCVAMPWAIGCASGARMVRADARGGELETWGAVVPATEQLREMLADHCQGRFTLVDQTTDRGDKTSGTERIAFSCGRARPANTPQAQGELAAIQSGVEQVSVVTPELRSAR